MASNCIFCQIVSKTAPGDILYEDDDVMVFKDIKPASKNHFLSIPKQHIKNAAHLTSADKAMLEKLKSVGLQVLEQVGGDKNDVLMGFHWPPCNSVSHLHLHIISPMSEMGFFSRLTFKPNTFWFVTHDYVLTRIENKL